MSSTEHKMWWSRKEKKIFLYGNNINLNGSPLLVNTKNVANLKIGAQPLIPLADAIDKVEVAKSRDMRFTCK